MIAKRVHNLVDGVIFCHGFSLSPLVIIAYH